MIKFIVAKLLFNPAYLQAAVCRIVSVARFPFDGRLVS
jgi:hypothetical protein